MLLTIDIGNTSIGMGLFLKPHINKLAAVKKISVHPLDSVLGYRQVIKSFINDCSECSVENLEKTDVVISSVVPNVTPLIVASLKDLIIGKLILVSYKTTGGLSLNLKRRKTIGADRISNAAGGYFFFRQPVAVVDCGTATTLTIVGKNAQILGGAILPGIGLMQQALFRGTAKLPEIQIKTPKKFLGRDTKSAITSGIVYGTAGAVKNIIRGVEGEIASGLKIILTGGFAKILSPVLELNHILKPNLIFEGMRVIYLTEKGLKTY